MKTLQMVAIILLLTPCIYHTSALSPEIDRFVMTGITLYVGGVGPNNYSSIQAAIDNASAGDTVFVYAGTYTEILTINKTINLIGQDRTSTILKSITQKANIVTITADHVLISGFTCDLARHNGYGIVVSGHNCTISQNALTNFIYDGCGIYIQASFTFVINNTFRAGGIQDGVCIVIGRVDHNTITGNIFKDAGEGVLLLRGADNNLIGKNHISNQSAGIEFYAGDYHNIIRNNEITNNQVGLWFYQSNENTICCNNITNNSYWGVYLFISLVYQTPSNYNLFYCNNFIGNADNAYDECCNFWWKFSLGHCIGNYWDDYPGLKHPQIVDYNHDGIGFLPFKISNAIIGSDRFPLMKPYKIDLN